MTVEEINKQLANLSEEERNNVSDWYHTFGELYEHRCTLYVALVNLAYKYEEQFREFYYRKADHLQFIKSKKHFDWSEFEWWFILQWKIYWKQVSYHLPIKYWDKLKNVTEQEKANKRDWHTSQDVLDRLLLV